MTVNASEYERIKARIFAEVAANQTAATDREEFHRKRSGLFTASQLHRLLTSKAARADNATSRQYIYETAFERLTGHWVSDGIGNAATKWGQEHEADMVAAFEKKSGIKVISTQRFAKADNAPFGATLDGETEDGGILEGKCPYNGGIHLQNLAMCHDIDWFKSNRFDYFVQCQGGMWAARAPFTWFVSYDPAKSRKSDPADRVAFQNFEPYKCGFWRIERDDAFINTLRGVVMEAEKDLQRIIENLKLPY